MDLWDDLADERRAIADLLESLTPEQWATQTLCEAWDVHAMAAHLAVPCTFSTLEMVTTMVRARGNPDRLSVLMAARRAELSPAELVALLREKAGARKAPPIVGVLGPYTDALVHTQDVMVPLDLNDDRPAVRWLPSLEFLVSRRARVGFVAAPLPAVRMEATDMGWAHGAGPEVRGTAADLALAMLRRTARLDALTGEGAPVLREWAAA
ncbi:maleylpyruvate isomerase family mycothiol-dependent enzyme [Solicola sp. PLA-1-18]|uniref:maleylpyruvate isomerase family mycothiol-dependent enzyme n=1 Tax=Solicola sp. PLA-1-18 TaxID=3380532 RepID=UPI003B7B6CF2